MWAVITRVNVIPVCLARRTAGNCEKVIKVTQAKSERETREHLPPLLDIELSLIMKFGYSNELEE